MARIIVIDDEQYIRTALKEVLENEGFKVSAARDGRRGLELLEDEGADRRLRLHHHALGESHPDPLRLQRFERRSGERFRGAS